MKKFDRDKYLKKLKFKRAWRKYERYFYIGVPCLMITILGIYFTYSKFSSSKEEEVVRTTVGEFIHGDVVIGAYIDGEYSKTIPGKNDGYIVKNVVCDNGAVGTWNDDKWGLLTTNMTKRTKCNIYFETKKTSLIEAITTAMSSNPSTLASDDPDNNIRYNGKDPSNYVYFNCSDYNNQSDSTCEKWRIIGVFNNVTKSDGTKENLVKIIRDEEISYAAWDSNDVNDWSTTTLQQNLNSGTYYTTTLKNDATRNAIESVVWNLGGVNPSSWYPSEFYSSERGTTVYSGRPTTWTGKIGLMYPSDIGYAAGGYIEEHEGCLATSMLDWDSGACYYNDYLFKSSYVQWTLAPFSGDAHQVFYLDSNDDINFSYASNTFAVRPSLYLKSSISVVDGNGTSTSPYKLEM